MRLKGFKNSPTRFAEALYQDLAEFHRKHPNVNLLQNVDDLLIIAKEKGNVLTRRPTSSRPCTS